MVTMITQVASPVKRIPTKSMLEFRFVSGDRALDFLATFADRHRAGVERLREPADLDRWLKDAGLGSHRASEADLDAARRLREVVNRIARTAILRRPANADDVGMLNAWAAKSPLMPQLDEEYRVNWSSPEPVTGALAIVAREAVSLLSSSDRNLIRECTASPACSLLYLDRSRGRRRRWCEMSRCGSRVKMAGHRSRRRSDIN
jgi:predicted RNA-binding Zn ribbon-like protein